VTSPGRSSSKCSLISVHAVCSVALQPTAGLRRGVRVRATGGPTTVLIGDALLGRLLDGTGNVRDDRAARAVCQSIRPLTCISTGGRWRF
jgi:F-type H+-transporting ATPase subunit beta